MNLNYNDVFKYSLRIKEVRLNSGFHIYENRNVVYGIRYNINGCWYIISSVKPISRKFIHPAITKFKSNICGLRFLDAELFKGSITIGTDADVEELLNELSELKKEHPYLQDILIRLVNEVKEFENDNGIALISKYKYFFKALVRANSINLTIDVKILGNLRNLMKFVKSKLDEITEKIKVLKRSIRSVKPHELGKWNVILDSESAAPLINYIERFLVLNRTNIRLLRQKMFIKSITIADNPLNNISINTTFFDDECVRTSRKVLIEDGELITLLSTRNVELDSKLEEFEITPGNAYGVLSTPKPAPTTLEVFPGDWNIREMIQESRRALLIEGYEWFKFSNNVIYLKPSITWYISDSNIKEPINVKVIKLVFPTSILRIEGISKEVKYVNLKSSEKTYVIPYIKTLGGVE